MLAACAVVYFYIIFGSGVRRPRAVFREYELVVVVACAEVPARSSSPIGCCCDKYGPGGSASPLENRWIRWNVVDFSRGSRRRARFLRTTVRTRVPRLFDELLPLPEQITVYCTDLRNRTYDNNIIILIDNVNNTRMTGAVIEHRCRYGSKKTSTAV